MPKVLPLTESYDVRRAEATTALAGMDFKSLSAQDLNALKARAGFGAEQGVFEVPAAWLPPTAQNASRRRIELHKELAGCNPADEAELAAWVDSLTRTLLASYLLSPSAGMARPPKPSTFMVRAATLLRTAREALRLPTRRYGRVFAHLDVQGLRAVAAPGLKSLPTTLSEFRRRGLIEDWPDLHATDELASHLEKSPKARRHKLLPRAEQAPFQPLPDEFVAQAGWRSAWMVRKLAPELLTTLEQFVQVQQEAVLLPTNVRASARRMAWFQPLRWDNVPSFAVFRPNGKEMKFPPRDTKELLAAVSLMQGINLFVLLLGIGSRASEVLSFTTESLVLGEDSREGRILGSTFKLSERPEGEARDWPLPELGVLAFENQKRMAELVRQLPGATESDALWFAQSAQATKGGWGAGAVNLATVLHQFPGGFGLTQQLGEVDRLHTHRFRKTIARLVALALTQSPKLLMDLFGHKTVEMTLHYILTDPMLRSEIDEVAKAQVVMFAQQAIENAESNAGPAADKLRQAVAAEKARLGQEAFGAEEVSELAQVLSLNGRIFALVRPGVLCTKGPGEAGPCSRKVGHPEPSRCRSSCDYRLETAALRDDTDRSIAEAVEHLLKARADDDEFAVELWKGQLLTHLPRFPDLRDKWKSHPAVASLLCNAKQP